MDAKLTDGILFDIQGFSVHDGPGCRTLIFLKGCSLQCRWCSNPEGLHFFPEPFYNSSKCIYDSLCIGACNKAAITSESGEIAFDTRHCRDCVTYDCAKACCTGALRIGGYRVGLTGLMKKIQRDRQYWGKEGGITLTGGEPFMQPDFVRALLQNCHQSYIHTAVETCGNVDWKSMEPSVEFLDWIFYDLKQLDDQKHSMMTGSGNRLILENARKLADNFKGRLIFRMPVVPGFNDSDEHIVKLSAFIKSIGKDELNILPLHHLGREKYRLTGRSYYTSDFSSPSTESMNRIRSAFTTQGIRCYVGSDTPY